MDTADLALAAARASTIRAEGDLNSARIRLARLLGREGSSGLTVEDPAITTQALPAVAIEDIVARAPRVRAADAEARAARHELESQERSAWPQPTLGAFLAQNRRDIPEGSFQGPGSAGLSANWTDTELGFRVGVPLPVFERKQSERAAATGRILAAEALATRARADVRQDVESAWTMLVAARRAFEELAGTPATLEREFGLVEKSFKVGALDLVTRAVMIRSIQGQSSRSLWTMDLEL